MHQRSRFPSALGGGDVVVAERSPRDTQNDLSPRIGLSARLWIVLAIAAGMIVSSGCGVVGKTKSLFGGELPVEVIIASNANQNSPIAVELVIVYEKALLEKLLEMEAKDWFREREQLARDFPDAYESWQWEWVPTDPDNPADSIEPMTLTYRVGVKGAVVFADYFSNGVHRKRIDPHKPVRLEFNEAGFTTRPFKGKKKKQRKKRKKEQP